MGLLLKGGWNFQPYLWDYIRNGHQNLMIFSLLERKPHPYVCSCTSVNQQHPLALLVTATNVQSIAETLWAIIYRKHSRKALNDAVEIPGKRLAFDRISVKYVSSSLRMSFWSGLAVGCPCARVPSSEWDCNEKQPISGAPHMFCTVLPLEEVYERRKSKRIRLLVCGMCVIWKTGYLPSGQM